MLDFLFGGGGLQFNPDQDVPDLDQKVYIVTGGNIGLGYETIYQLAKHNPGHIYLAARSKEKADKAIADIKKDVPNAKITHLQLDLSSFDSIKKAADEFTASNSRLDVLINNAGIMMVPQGKTKEGYEIQFGTNHMGHALLTKLLLPTLKKTAADGHDVRVLNLSSDAHKMGAKGGLVLDQVKGELPDISSFRRYGHSKLANIHFNRALAQHNPDIRCVSIHPGAVRTNLVSGPSASYPRLVPLFNIIFPFLTGPVQKGALNQIWAATSNDIKTGQYYVPVAKISEGSAEARNEKLTKDLWDWTEKELASHGY